MAKLIFILLFLLNFPHSNLSSIPCEFIPKEMEKFCDELENSLKKYAEEFSAEIIAKTKVKNEMQILKEFPEKIEQLKLEIIKYLEKEDSQKYEEIVEKLKIWRNELEENKKELKINSQIELAQNLIELFENRIEFVDKIGVELKIRMPFENYLALKEGMKNEKAKMDLEFGKIIEKNEKEIYGKIREIILEKKEKLREEFKRMNFDENSENWPEELKKNLGILKKEVLSEKPTLEKVKLKFILLKGVENGVKIAKIQRQIREMGELIEEEVDGIPKLLMKGNLFVQEKKEYSNFRKKINKRQYLLSASQEMLDFVGPLISGKFDQKRKNYYLKRIHWLGKIIARKFEVQKILFDSKKLEKKELPEEWLIGGKMEKEEEKMDEQEKLIILMAKNMEFIQAKLKQIYNFDEANRHASIDGRELVMLGKNGIAPEKAGLFFYQKYLEAQKPAVVNANNAEADSGSSTNVSD